MLRRFLLSVLGSFIMSCGGGGTPTRSDAGDAHVAEGGDINLPDAADARETIDAMDVADARDAADAADGRDGANACSPEVCDGIDNDCDGDVDEDLPPLVVYADADGDGYGDGGSARVACGPGDHESLVADDCDDDDSDVHPGAEEACNGLDDNCDLRVDEDLSPLLCPLQAGVCADTQARCGGLLGWIACDASDYVANDARYEEVEATCDGRDNDCDGDVDEFLLNACGTCGPTPDEECNGLDDDCDGNIDDGVVRLCPNQIGVCALATARCLALDGWAPCGAGDYARHDASYQLSEDRCDGQDNDCDGATDAGLLNRCGACGALPDETCNGVDDDCDGAIDEDLGRTTCGTGECVRSVDNCVRGIPQDCTPGASAPEACDGLDNDCNGVQDDGLGQTTCGTGACQRTVDNCAGGMEQVCTPGDPSPELCANLIDDDCDGAADEVAPEECNGEDDDCNGMIDDGLGQTSCGVGACRRVVENCLGGVPQACVPGEPVAEVCNGVDDDCDGFVDEGQGTIRRVGSDVRVTNTPSATYNPDLAWTGSQVGLAWQEGSNSEIWFQRTSSQGTPLGTAERLDTAVGMSEYASAAWSGSEFGVAWDDSRTGDLEIFFARVDVNGAPIDFDVRVTNAVRASANPSLLWTASDYSLAWDDARSSDADVYFVHLSADGMKMGDERALGVPGATHPTIAWSGTEFGVAWDLGSQDVYFARMSIEGVRVGAAVQITNVAGNSLLPSITWTGSEFATAWEDWRDGNAEIYFVRVSADGIKQGSELRVTNDPAASRRPRILWARGEYLIVWDDTRNGDFNADLFSARIAPNGSRVGGDARLVASGDSIRASIVWTGSEYMLGWSDDRDGNRDIYVGRAAVTCP